MTEFTPLQSLTGGALIGAAAVLLMALHGRIAGITGILGGLLVPGDARDRAWRAAFVAGMVASPIVYLALTALLGSGLAWPPALQSDLPLGLHLVGGAIVGIGVTFASGCTSGHGVCGLARLSRRSLAATATFMATAAATVFLFRHVLGG